MFSQAHGWATRPVAMTVVALVALAWGACGDDGGGAGADGAAPDVGADAAADTGGVVDPLCTLEMEGQACDDGDPCTLDDQCFGGRCVGGGTLACDDPDPCRTGRCEANVGCVYEPLDEGASCSLACFTRATCQGGHCTPEIGSGKQCPEPTDPCIDHFSCDSSTGQCNIPIYAPAGAPCDRDGDACTVDECDGAGACEDTLTLETCAAQSNNNPCWTYSCVKATGCVRSAFVEGASCDDLNPCTGGDVCVVNSLGQQTCLGTPLPIDDSNPCTSDACVAGTITHTPIDGIVCTIPNDLCVGAGLCSGGMCQTEPSVDCDDGDACTIDACVPATGACSHSQAPDQTPCDDHNACTTADRCLAGQCAGAPIPSCCGNGACEQGEGCDCADCEGQICDDGDACTVGDACHGGQCVSGSAVPNCCGNGTCEPGEACTCVSDCDGKPCDDGNACTTGDLCSGDQCGGSMVLGCCGNGLCELGELCGCADCDGQVCDDGNACTTGETCGGGQCGGGATLANCCGNGDCEEGERCGCADCDGLLCDDGNACTAGETCGQWASDVRECGGGSVLANCCGNGICEPGEQGSCDDCP